MNPAEFLSLTALSWNEAVIRIALAAIFGLVLGWDRDRKNKPIDFRAYMIVCVATCMTAILSLEMYAVYKNSEDFIGLDLGKIISGALTGIGFLGAGAIIKRNNDEIVGTATGASIWAAGSMGLALGYGAYGLALLGFIVIASILIIGGLCMKKFNGRDDKEEKPGGG